MKKVKLAAIFGAMFMISTTTAHAENVDTILSQSKYQVSNTIQKSNFKREPSRQDKAKLLEIYKQDSDRVFNDEFAKELYSRDQALIKSHFENRSADKNLYYKETLPIEKYTTRNSSSSLGTYGDILVVYSFSSFGINVGATGHAAIVHTDSSRTIESVPAWFDTSKKDGVWFYPNDWKSRSKVYGVRVKGANSTHYTNAAKYAIQQANLRKKYNLNFFDKGTTKSFYCSQLVWRAWKNQGFDIDRMNLGDWEPVSPAELVGGGNTYVFYHKN